MKKVWYEVLSDKSKLKEGRVTTVKAGNTPVCLTHFEGKYCALTNVCPHQGGPLGEGSIENGVLRCPWHGWDYHPCTGIAPGFDDGAETYDLKVEGDKIFVALDEPEEHKATISDVMVETMVNWGINTVFGMVGHSNLGLGDALRRQEIQGNLKYIGIRHEGAGAFAASAYGKLTGKPAACFTIAGPGATNLYTGLWDAKVDRSPLLALTGQVDTQVVGTGNFQELDLVAAFDAVANFNHRVLVNSNHAELMSLAVKHSLLDRNVSHLTFPDEVQTIVAHENSKAKSPEGRLPELQIAPPASSLDKALDLINTAKNPIIIVGHGSRFHMDSIIELAESLNCPVLTTFKGKGQIGDNHELACGVLGRSGTPVASFFMNTADLIIVIGASFSKHTGITPKIPTIQIDFDPLALSKFHKITVPLWGEISVTVASIKEKMNNTVAIDRREHIKDRWAIWRNEKQRRLNEDMGDGVSSIAIFTELTKQAPKDAVMCVDVGNNAYSFGRYFETTNQSFLISGYLGSIGFALPASMGAWAAVNDTRPIIAVAGDGGVCQYLAEITTLVRYNMPIKLLILNNMELGKISKEQTSALLDVWATELVNPDFSEYANGCGALGLKVTNRSELAAHMETWLKHDGPAVLEVIADVKLI